MSDQANTSSGNLQPATPAYVFRGHTSALHALHFFSSNRYLASADADGWVVVWSLTTKRPVAVWRAHQGSILGIQSWGAERLITHGRDHSLRVWQLRDSDYENLDKTLPAQRSTEHNGPDPWLLHSMPVNALNFCAFALHGFPDPPVEEGENFDSGSSQGNELVHPIIIACPNALDSGGIDMFHLPSERRLSVLKADANIKTGMVMALKLTADLKTGQLLSISGYEDGHVMIHRRLPQNPEDWNWEKIYVNCAHSQPVLSLDVASSRDYFISSSADAILLKHPITTGKAASRTSPMKTLNTKHAGQQSLTIRDDCKIFATAGWDARVRLSSSKSLRELAVLKWHSEGCYAVAFAMTDVDAAADGNENQSVQQIGSALAQIKQQRSSKAQQTHWLAAGAKDGKVSLWDIY